MIRLRARGVVQDVRRLAHLDHEGGLPAREIVARADAGEDAVHEIDARLRGRDERAGVREQREQRDLPDVGALARHVRPGDERDLGKRAAAPPVRMLRAHSRPRARRWQVEPALAS